MRYIIKSFENFKGGINNRTVFAVVEGGYVLKSFRGKTAQRRALSFKKKL